MTLVPNDDHVQEALDNRIEDFKTKTRFGQLLTSYVQQMQEAEDAAIQILQLTELNSAFGQQLDNLGEIIGEERFGRADVQYSTALAARIQLNLSNGTIEDIINIIRAIAGDVEVDIVEVFPAGFTAEIVDDLDPDVVDLVRLSSFVKSAKPVGVRGLILFHVADPFQFDTGFGYDLGHYGGAE